MNQCVEQTPGLVLGIAVWLAACEAGSAFEVLNDSATLNESPQIYPDYLDLLRKEIVSEDSTPASRTPKLQMFRMPSGFLATPLGLYPDEDPPRMTPSRPMTMI